MRTLWKYISWVLIACGAIAYLIGWISLLTGTKFWQIPTEFWFFDTTATGVLGIFFLVYAVYEDKH